MTSPIRPKVPSSLETDYKERIRLSSRDNSATYSRSVGSASLQLPEDVVTLSSARLKEFDAPKQKPSQPVSPAEKQALQTQFSVYG